MRTCTSTAWAMSKSRCLDCGVPQLAPLLPVSSQSLPVLVQAPACLTNVCCAIFLMSVTSCVRRNASMAGRNC